MRFFIGKNRIETMVQYIIWLRVLAACLITNSHYTGIYPSDIIANGGLIGDVIFFAVSGYCLYNVKKSFVEWYTLRIIRIFIPVWIGTLIYLFLGLYHWAEKTLIGWFVYPTYYHFVASIMVLYIPFFLIVTNRVLKQNLVKVMCFIGIAMLIIYICMLDLSYYHIDNVREPYIRFLFMESMLLGAYFKQNDQKYRNKTHYKDIVLLSISFVIYFISKIVFSKIDILSEFQIINQIIIFILLYYIMKTFAGLDSFMEARSKTVKTIVSFIGKITLEIYVVQYVIIELFRNVAPFPINWIIVSGLIFASAIMLNRISIFFIEAIIFRYLSPIGVKVINFKKGRKKNEKQITF